MKIVSDFVKAVMAGFCIGVGGTVYLSLIPDNKPLGSFLFAIGLFLIFCYGFNLFTGKVGFVFDEGLRFVPTLGIIWLGNFVGTAAVGLSLSLLTRDAVSKKLAAGAEALCKAKLEDNLLSVFVLAIFCGFLMFVAADNYKNGKDSLQKHLATFLPVAVFILAGFEHCVANMFYFAAAGVFTGKMLLYLAVMTAGNACGSFIVPLAKKLIKQ